MNETITIQCPDCQGTYPEGHRHFCPRCAKCNAVIESDVKHVCPHFICPQCKTHYYGQHNNTCPQCPGPLPEGPKLKKVNKTALRKPMDKGGILGMRIKIGKLHCVIRGGIGGQLTLHPIGLEE